MISALTDKLQNLITSFVKNKTLTEENLSKATSEIRLALLEADVNYSVTSSFVKRVKQRVLGEKVIKSVSPKQQFIKIIHDELVTLMGGEEKQIDLSKKPTVIMLCGLQGSGKTTQVVKLAHFLRKKHRKILLAACDLQRMAAIDQLKQLGAENDFPVFYLEGEKSGCMVAKKALEKAINDKYDLLIIDTAGRLHVDESMMGELLEIKEKVNPSEILFVANATTGQDAVKAAKAFDEKVAITGSILTMLDGDARAGSAISIAEVTKKPLLFEGIGERVDDLQPFHPESMANRILGRGDLINLVRKAENAALEENELQRKSSLKIKNFSYEDYLSHMGMIKKMGSLKGLMKMIPGMSSFGDLAPAESEMKKIEAIIYSMTVKERREDLDICYMRRKRLAKGSGTSLDDVNRMVKGFKRIKQLMKNMPKKGLKGMMPNRKDIQNQLGGKLWL